MLGKKTAGITILQPARPNTEDKADKRQTSEERTPQESRSTDLVKLPNTRQVRSSGG